MIPEVVQCYRPNAMAVTMADIATRIGLAAVQNEMRIIYPIPGDNRASIQAALDASEYRPVRFFPGFFHCIGGITVRRGTTVYANGAFLKCDTSGLDRAVDMSSDSSWYGGKVTCERLSGGLSADDHCCFRAGHYADGIGVSNVTIKNVELEVLNFSGCGVFISGPTDNVTVDGVTYGDSEELAVVVCMHWGYKMQPELGTFHPRNITVRNVNCGILGNSLNASSEAVPVSVSACYNVDICNVYSTKARFGALYVTGDYGYKYSGFPATPGSVNFRNVTCKQAVVAGIWVNNWGTHTGTINPGFVSFDDCTMFGSFNGNGEAGVYLYRSYHTRFRNCVISGFPVGIKPIGDVSDNQFSACLFERNNQGTISPPNPGVIIS